MYREREGAGRPPAPPLLEHALPLQAPRGGGGEKSVAPDSRLNGLEGPYGWYCGEKEGVEGSGAVMWREREGKGA